jgi:hypothetical protein
VLGILKNDIFAVFGGFQNKGQFEKSFNATFVSLVPKKTCAMDGKDFHPISFVGEGEGGGCIILFPSFSQIGLSQYLARLSPTH